MGRSIGLNMRKINWKSKLDELKYFVGKGWTDRQISAFYKTTSDAVWQARRRYGIKQIVVPDGDLISVKNGKLKRADINKLARILGEQLYHEYKNVRLIEPKCRKYKEGREEHSILDISDTHVGMINKVFDSSEGKEVVTYDMSVFKQYMNNLYSSIFEIHSILSNSYNLRELTINFLGDLVTNDRIFPEQAFEIEKVVGLQVWDAINYFTAFFNNLLKIYDKVNIICVVGNHGRSLPNSYSEPVENSFEYFVYKTWQKQFADSKRINVVVPSTRRYIHEIYGWKHLIEHGDSMRGSTDSFIERQIKDLSLNVTGFDVMHFGHFHKLKEREIADKVIVKQNGCWILKDGYAFKKYKTYSVPKQHFFGCNLKRPETWAYKIDLRG